MSLNNKHNIIIADTQFLIIEALKNLLHEFETIDIAGIASSTFELYKLLEEGTAQILITDVNLIDFTNIDELKAIKLKYPALSVLVMNNHFTRSGIAELHKAGIKNMVCKTAEKDEIMDAINSTILGKKYYCSEVLDILLEIQNKKSSHETHQLTTSEIDIVRLIAEGLTTKEIAEKKFLSIHTVMTHRKNIFRKTDVNNASELLMYAMKKGLFDLEYYI